MINTKKYGIAVLGFCLSTMAGLSFSMAKVTEKAVLVNYSNIALAGYEDSLKMAKELDKAIKSLSSNPSSATLKHARDVWIAARIPYQQTEVFRFGNYIVDDWEGRVNAWPLDEGLIDYVDSSYESRGEENSLYLANVIANKKLKINGKEMEVTSITPSFLAETLHETGEVEENVATGYHAIEFLLWGQDLNGTRAGAGNRPYTDFNVKNCTGGHCERRLEYLNAASELMIADLQEMVDNWKENGAARKHLLENEPSAGISAILTGMGSLSYGEVAGERMKLGLLLHDPEEEQDCFSDNTHNSHFYNAIGIRNVYLGRYSRIDGTVVEGPSVSELLKEKSPAVAGELSHKLNKTVADMQVMVKRAESGEAYDQQIGEGNSEGNAVVQAVIDSLVDQTRTIERAVAILGIDELEIEGSDSLNNPASVFK